MEDGGMKNLERIKNYETEKGMYPIEHEGT